MNLPFKHCDLYNTIITSETQVRHLFVKSPGFPTRHSNKFNHLRPFLGCKLNVLVVARLAFNVAFNFSDLRYTQRHVHQGHPSSTPKSRIPVVLLSGVNEINELRCHLKTFGSGNNVSYMCWQFVLYLLHSLYVHQTHPLRGPQLRAARRVVS